MTGPRRATAPPLAYGSRSGTAARRTISYHSKDRKPDSGWGHFKPPRWGHCKPPQRTERRDPPRLPACLPSGHLGWASSRAPPLTGRRSPDFIWFRLQRTFTPWASKSKALLRRLTHRAAGRGSSRTRRSPPRHRTRCWRHDAAGTQISVTSGAYGWVLPQSSVPPIPMLRGVCIALTASWNDGTRGIGSRPALLLAPSAYSQKVMGAPGRPPCGSTASGGPRHYPTGPKPPQPRRKSCTAPGRASRRTGNLRPWSFRPGSRVRPSRSQIATGRCLDPRTRSRWRTQASRRSVQACQPDPRGHPDPRGQRGQRRPSDLPALDLPAVPPHLLALGRPAHPPGLPALGRPAHLPGLSAPSAP